MTNTERFLEGFGEPIKSSRIFPESIYSLDIWLQLKQLVKRISFSPKYTYRTILYCSTIKTTDKYIVLTKFVLISHTSGLTTQTIRYDNLLTTSDVGKVQLTSFHLIVTLQDCTENQNRVFYSITDSTTGKKEAFIILRGNQPHLRIISWKHALCRMKESTTEKPENQAILIFFQ